jgi:serine/threonine protein kinase
MRKDDKDTTDRVGQQLGNERLLRFVGRGEFAEVYLGEHVYLNMLAGVKVLQAQLTTPQAMQAFLQEGQNIARLVHPSIIRVLDFGVEQGVPFLIMEYAPNGTLRQRYPDRTPLPVRQVVTYANQVASAAQYAHDRRLIHRDIKPENMLLSAGGTILLSDFGISTVARTSRSLRTQDISGTGAYMAPSNCRVK